MPLAKSSRTCLVSGFALSHPVGVVTAGALDEVGEIFRGLFIREFLRVFFQHLHTLSGGGELVVVRDPWVAAVVLDAPLETKCLCNVEAVLIVEGDRGGILDIRLAGEEFGHHSFGRFDVGEDGFYQVE